MLFLCICLIFENHQIPPNIFYDIVVKYDENRRCALSLMSKIHFDLEEIRSYYIDSRYQRYDVYAMSFGNERYRENFVRIGFRIGVQHTGTLLLRLAGYNYWIKNYTTRFHYAINAGFLWRRDQSYLQVEARNLNVPRFSATDYIPLILSIQGVHAVKPSLSVLGAVQSIQGSIPSYHFGIQMTPFRQVRIGAGIMTAPPCFDCMFTLILGRMRVSYFGNVHVVLGLSHALAMGVGL